MSINVKPKQQIPIKVLTSYNNQAIPKRYGIPQKPKSFLAPTKLIQKKKNSICLPTKRNGDFGKKSGQTRNSCRLANLSTVASSRTYYQKENMKICNVIRPKIDNNQKLFSKTFRERSRSSKRSEKISDIKTTPGDSNSKRIKDELTNDFNENKENDFLSFHNDVKEDIINSISDNNVSENSLNQTNKFTLCQLRSIKDIKDEYLLTKKTSESIQSKILKESCPLSIESQYQKLLLQKEKNVLQLKENIKNITFGSFGLNKAQDKNFNQNEYRKLLETCVVLEYGDNILDDYFENEEKIEQCLANHEITPKMRMKMVDWMVEVFSKIKSTENTFFMSVNIMDRYFKRAKIRHKPEELLLIGMGCIFISSKFCEIYPIKLNFLVEKIGHNSFTRQDILKIEDTIMKSLDYSILTPTIFEFSNFYFEVLFHFYENNFGITNGILSKYLKDFIHDLGAKSSLDYENWLLVNKYTKNLKSFFKLVLIYLLKMSCLDYELSNEKPSYIAAGAILVAMKICEEVNKENYVNEYFIERLSQLSRQTQQSILSLGSKVLFNVQHYDEVYKDMNNLYNIHFSKIGEVSNTK